MNGDLVVGPDALAELVGVARNRKSASQPAFDFGRPDRLNSAGNEVHFLGFSWWRVRRARRNERSHAPSPASWARRVLRRPLWDELGGFGPEYFAYHEDAELCRRCWHRGLERVRPEAVGVHRYEFGREASKMYLAERNR